MVKKNDLCQHWQNYWPIFSVVCHRQSKNYWHNCWLLTYQNVSLEFHNYSGIVAKILIICHHSYQGIMTSFAEDAHGHRYNHWLVKLSDTDGRRANFSFENSPRLSRGIDLSFGSRCEICYPVLTRRNITLFSYRHPYDTCLSPLSQPLVALEAASHCLHPGKKPHSFHPYVNTVILLSSTLSPAVSRLSYRVTNASEMHALFMVNLKKRP